MSAAIEIKDLSLRVNGAAVGPIPVPVGTSLLDVLHEWLGLTGSRMGCGQGICHACTVMLEEAAGPREMRACITGAHWFEGRKVRTVEGVAKKGAGGALELTPVQQAFIEHFSFQCGYCTPGFVVGATVLLDKLRRNPVRRADLERTITEALDGHICRCTGYVRYYEAVHEVVLKTPGLVRG